MTLDDHIINCIPLLFKHDFDITERNYDQPFFIFYDDDESVLYINPDFYRTLHIIFNITKSDALDTPTVKTGGILGLPL